MELDNVSANSLYGMIFWWHCKHGAMKDINKLIMCSDANKDIYKKLIGKALTDKDGLAMKEVVGEHTGQQLGATYF